MGYYAKPKPTTEAETCRGRAGKSRPHIHYRGRVEARTRSGLLVSRCTSCNEIVTIKASGGYQARAVTSPEALQALALDMLAAL